MSRTITLQEVRSHKEDCWIVIENSVYDVKAYLQDHPGGPDALLDHAGEDATQAFVDVGHSDEAKAIREKYKIGDLPDHEKKHVRCAATCSDRQTHYHNQAVLSPPAPTALNLTLTAHSPSPRNTKTKDPKTLKVVSPSESVKSKSRSRSRSPGSSRASSRASGRSSPRDEAAGFFSDRARKHDSIYCLHPSRRHSDSRERDGDPESSSWWVYALAVLGAAAIAGIVYHKMAT